MLCHGVMDCMMDAPEGLLPCTAGGGDPRWGARGGREARSDQVGLADEKEWKRLWRIMRLSDGRAAHEDVDMDDAPLEPCAEAAQAGGFHAHFDVLPVHTPGQVLGTMEEAHMCSRRWAPLGGLEAMHKRGIERVDDADGAAARPKRPRVRGPGWAF
eukprot:evm.model.scf_155.7 EVM.evm.TU.scf_155.7   scf_155:89366-91918(+)